MVKAWVADIRPLLDEGCYKRYYEVLPSFRQEKADKIKRKLNKAQSVGVWSLWEKIKKAYQLPEDSSFNLSHSGFFVMCAAELEKNVDVQVGCDIEQIREANLKMAHRYFCPAEYKRIVEAADRQRQNEMFFRYWVLKESFMKATRKGMALALDTFEIVLGTPSILINKPADFTDSYYYREYEIEGEPYKMAVCSTQEEIDSKIRTEFKL